MISRGKNTMLKLALLGSLVAFVAAEGNQQVLRKRIQTENSGLQESQNGKRDDLWGEVASNAQFEEEQDVYRELQFVGSMPSPPSANPPTLPPFMMPTLSPVACNGVSREDYILSILSQITDENILLNRLTPQGAAYHHMVNFDEYLTNPCDKNIPQRYALLTLYYSTTGDQWSVNTGWKGGAMECNWVGVQCKSGLVTEIDLEINNLNGELLDEMKVLSSLEELNLFANSISGSIPDGFRYLNSLEKLDLQENRLAGSAFPRSIYSLSNLRSYKVSGNMLSDPIPPEIANMNQLRELWAADNGIDGEIPPEIGNLRRLRTLALHENKIKGTLPASLGLIPFEQLILHTNFLNGELPGELFSVASLKELRLDGNFFRGDLPTQIGLMTNLEDLRLDNNNLDGSIPAQLNTLTNLQYLMLAENFWTGRIPDVFANHEVLEYFDISGNEGITGNLPASVFSSPSIKFVYMHKCPSLGGTIPNSFSNPPELRDLYLYSTGISGTVPTISSGKLLKLNEFLVQDTSIRGAMPTTICNLRDDGILDDLWSDCGGQEPEIECSFPDCCNRCFEGVTQTS